MENSDLRKGLTQKDIDNIEMGKAMLCRNYLIEVATDAWGNDNGQGVYVFDENGNIPPELHKGSDQTPSFHQSSCCSKNTKRQPQT